MKRFYKEAAPLEVEFEVEGEAESGWTVGLDGRPIKTPAKSALILPTKALAIEIASEWDGQGEEVVPTSMAAMTLAVSAIDRITPQMAAIVDDLAGYAGSDTLCYRATDPNTLVEKQSQAWDPVLKRAEDQFGLRFVLAGGIIHQAQPDETLLQARNLLMEADCFELSALHTLISITGSFVLGLFVWRGEIDAATAFDLGLLEELYQAEVWGSDSEAEDRRKRLKADILSAERFLALLKQK